MDTLFGYISIYTLFAMRKAPVTLGKQLDFKVDPTGAPHVGGNRWAGGSGGSDTAGLGGRGGPYRLWDGNPVAWHQMLSPPDFFREILGEIRFS